MPKKTQLSKKLDRNRKHSAYISRILEKEYTPLKTDNKKSRKEAEKNNKEFFEKVTKKLFVDEKANKKRNKPKIKDGHHLRWYYHPFSGWEVVDVGPWDNKKMSFNRSGFEETRKHWVGPTKEWQWGEKLEEPKIHPNKKIKSDGSMSMEYREEMIKLVSKIRS